MRGYTSRPDQGKKWSKFKEPIVWPPAVEEIKLAYEADLGLHNQREVFCAFSPENLRSYLRTFHDLNPRIRLKIHGTVSPCFSASGNKREIEKLRSRIATEIGLAPAQFFDFLDFYDYEFITQYRYHYTVMCKYHDDRCISPSHLILIRSVGVKCRYPLTPSDRREFFDL